MVIGFLLPVSLFIIAMSLRTLFLPNDYQGKSLSWESFVYLLFIYSTVFIGFGIIYFSLTQTGQFILLEGGKAVGPGFFKTITACLYFSGITLFSIGYGDIYPVGAGRIVAIAEGLIGYTIPAAFVVRTFVDFRREKGL